MKLERVVAGVLGGVLASLVAGVAAAQTVASDQAGALAPVGAPTMTAEAAWAYLVQGVCADPKQPPLPGGCAPVRLQRETDPVYWRKHDWPNRDGLPPQGWQASDSVFAVRGGVTFASQTSDFGPPMADNNRNPDSYYRFDPGNDGGDGAIVVGDTASVFFTQDGGTPGIQWFIGAACPTGRPEKRVSWALFRLDAGPQWHYAVTQINGVTGPDRCPPRYNRALDAYRTVAPEFPLRWAGHESRAKLQAMQADHYALPGRMADSASAAEMIAASKSMERLFYAPGLGRVRWEAWYQREEAAKPAAELAATGRCPDLAESTPPGPGWYRVDCRHWGNITAEPGTWHVADYGWPPADLAP